MANENQIYASIKCSVNFKTCSHIELSYDTRRKTSEKKTFCDKHNLTVQVLITSGCICKVSFEIVNALRQQQLHLYQTREKKRNWIKKKLRDNGDSDLRSTILVCVFVRIRNDYSQSELQLHYVHHPLA